MSSSLSHSLSLGTAARPTRRIMLTARFLAVELALWGVLYGLYTGVRALAIGQEAEAFANARRVVDVEQALGIARERDLQETLTSSEGLRDLFDTYYELGFFPVMIGGLLVIGLRRRALYREIRNVLLLAIGVAAVLFIVIPTAPPRLVPDLGIRDTVGMLGHDVGSFRGIDYNPYAAMPSMHMGWTLLITIGLARLTSSRLVRLGLALHPPMMLLAVVATGNHFLLDAVVGSGIAVGSLLTVQALRRPRQLAGSARWRLGRPAGGYGRLLVRPDGRVPAGARGGD